MNITFTLSEEEAHQFLIWRNSKDIRDIQTLHDMSYESLVYLSKKIKEEIASRPEGTDLCNYALDHHYIRLANCLNNANIMTVGKILNKREQDIKSIRNFGKTSFQQLCQLLEDFGIELVDHNDGRGRVFTRTK